MSEMAFLAGGLAALCLAGAALARRFHAEREAERRRVYALEETCAALHDDVMMLHDSARGQDDLIQAMGDYVLRCDAQGDVVSANAGFRQMFGEERPAPLWRGPEQHDADGVVRVEERVETGSGERWIAWRHVPARDAQGRFTEILSVGRDITAHKRAESLLARAGRDAEAASGAKSRFLATMSHEIRTPMNGIMGMADLLTDTKLTPEQEAYVAAIRSSGEALLTLIDEVLDFSKIESGRLDLEETAFDLTAMVESAAELLAPRAQAKGLDIACAIAPDLPRRILADPTRLRQAVLNLAGNAVKFTDQGGIAIVLRRDGDDLVLAVRDTGPGIRPDDQARIFREFEQAEDGLARSHGGTGLGLAITRRIAERMGGALTLVSAPGEGSTFMFRVPLTAADTEEPASERLDGLSVLALSAHPVEMTVMASRLRTRGAEVVRPLVPEVPSEGHFDAVLIDQRLGEERLPALLAALKGRARRIVMVVTPKARGEIARYREHGVNGWLVSPVREASLLAQMRAGEASPEQTDRLTDPAPQKPAKPVPAARALKILLAEDNEINALLARTVLTKMGHEVLHAADGDAALSMALGPNAPFDLILLDVQMPHRDGHEVARLIREREGERRNAIYALTANAFVEDREAAINAGMDGFITKPLQRERLAEIIETISPSGNRAATGGKRAKSRR